MSELNNEEFELSKKADALFHASRYSEALPLYEELARRGQIDCQRYVGWSYISGSYMDKNPEKAEFWLRSAAEDEDGESQYLLSLALELQNKQDEAIYWLEKSVLNNFAPALVRLGTHYESGIKLKKDMTNAKNLYHNAHQLGNLFGSRFYGRMLMKGSDGFIKRFIGMYLYYLSFPKGVVISILDTGDKKLWL